MKTEKFVKLIQAITGRDFEIKTNDPEIVPHIQPKPPQIVV